MLGLAGATLGGFASGVVAREFVRRAIPARTLTRTNFRGEPISLGEGPTVAVALAAAAAPISPAAAVASLGAGAIGAWDDLGSDSDTKGLAGHVGALRRGQVTTGVVKIFGLVGTALGVEILADRGRDVSLIDRIVGVGIVAGSANLINLFDLRPGRALKVGGAIAALALPSRAPVSHLGAATLGTILAVAPDDLAGRTMLGDTGANALGAVLGSTVVATDNRRLSRVSLAAIVALTLLSERVSFTQIIEATPVLRDIDAWGR